MKSTEKKEERLRRVDMHDFFLNRIDDALSNKRYIEASWLIYSCFENRYFRTVEKIKRDCKYSQRKCKKGTNELALRTKVRCIQRLANENCVCFSNAFPDSLFTDTIDWIKERNSMMHNLLKLEEYQNMDKQFEKNAKEGYKLLKRTYNACTEFRKIYYDENYTFVFPENAMEKCSCKPHDNKKNTIAQ